MVVEDRVMEHRAAKHRRGFTLVEILVVIGIIAFLMSIMLVATMRFLTNARVASTKSLLTKIQRQLLGRLEALQRDDVYRTQTDLSGGIFLEATAVDRAARRTDLSMPPPVLAQRYKQVKAALARKSLTRQYLPQTWAEARYLLNRANKTAPMVVTQYDFDAESSEVLYFWLTDAAVKGYTPATADIITGSDLKDANKNGFPEIVDSWGKPLRFFRWPTRLLRPSGLPSIPSMPPFLSASDISRTKLLIPGLPSTLPTSANQDPDDSFNVLTPLASGSWCTSLAEAGAVEAGGTGIFSSSPFPLHTLFTWHTPLVVSAGQDGDFGIYPVNDSAHLGRLCEPDVTDPTTPALVDNITTLNITSGGN